MGSIKIQVAMGGTLAKISLAKINIIPELQRVPGVGQALVFGAKDYSMRIWLKPDRLTANGLSTQDVVDAIHEQNLEAAPGRPRGRAAPTRR